MNVSSASVREQRWRQPVPEFSQQPWPHAYYLLSRAFSASPLHHALVRHQATKGRIMHAPGDSSRSSSSSSPSSVPASVPPMTLPRGVGATLSSALSWVSALLSLSPPTRPAMSRLLRPRRRRPPRPGAGNSTGEGAGESEGNEAVSRIRRAARSVSMCASAGSVNSDRKKGCRERFSVGDGDGQGCGTLYSSAIDDA